jgi:hypothetical protein
MMAQHPPPAPAPVPGEEPGELRDFMLVVREALYLVIRYIERRYGKSQSPR